MGLFCTWSNHELLSTCNWQLFVFKNVIHLSSSCQLFLKFFKCLAMGQKKIRLLKRRPNKSCLCQSFYLTFLLLGKRNSLVTHKQRIPQSASFFARIDILERTSLKSLIQFYPKRIQIFGRDLERNIFEINHFKTSVFFVSLFRNLDTDATMCQKPQRAFCFFSTRVIFQRKTIVPSVASIYWKYGRCATMMQLDFNLLKSTLYLDTRGAIMIYFISREP